MAGQGNALGQSVATALSANDEALLADYVRRHAVQPRRPAKIARPAKNATRRTDQ
jgi:hypothetical protein